MVVGLPISTPVVIIVAAGVTTMALGFIAIGVSVVRHGSASLLGARLVLAGLGIAVAGVGALILLIPESTVRAPTSLLFGVAIGTVGVLLIALALRVRVQHDGRD